MPVKTFPKWLSRTPEEIAAEAQIQEQRRAGFSRAKLTEAERLIQRGVLLEETARGNLAAGSTEALAQLAEALAMQGRYGEAAQYHPDKRMRWHYTQIAEAVERDDEEKCDCPDTESTVRVGTEKVDLAITPRFNARTIYSNRHKGTVMLITCQTCGHLNARPPKSRLLLHQSALNQNIAAARSGIRGVADVQLLKKQ